MSVWRMNVTVRQAALNRTPHRSRVQMMLFGANALQ